MISDAFAAGGEASVGQEQRPGFHNPLAFTEHTDLLGVTASNPKGQTEIATISKPPSAYLAGEEHLMAPVARGITRKPVNHMRPHRRPALSRNVTDLGRGESSPRT